MKKKLYLTRDCGSTSGVVELWEGRPEWRFWVEKQGMWRPSRRHQMRHMFCFAEWTRLTGIKMKAGTIREVTMAKTKNGFTFKVGKEEKL